MAVATYITSQILRQEEVEDLKRTFLELDENNDGRLSHDELIRGYNTAMNLQLSLEEI
jgi:Ca2+-binding EF-hand superfamily protein